MSKPIAVTVDEDGGVLREHHDGFDWPGELTFESVNNFAHHPATTYEELQWLCLGLASELEKLRKSIESKQ